MYNCLLRWIHIDHNNVYFSREIRRMLASIFIELKTIADALRRLDVIYLKASCLCGQSRSEMTVPELRFLKRSSKASETSCDQTPGGLFEEEYRKHATSSNLSE